MTTPGSDSREEMVEIHRPIPSGMVSRVNPDGSTTRVAVASLSAGETFTLDDPASDLAAETGTPPIPPAPVWLEEESSPFGVPVLDIRPITWTSTSTTGDPAIATRFMESRTAVGSDYDVPYRQRMLSLPCDITYPPLVDTTAGVLFMASVMEEKWDVFFTGGLIRVLRSWTGDLMFVGRTRPSAAPHAPIHVDQIDYPAAARIGAGEALAEFDFVMKAYVYGAIVPYRSPDALAGKDVREIAVAAFSKHGRRAAYTAFIDMTLGMGAPEPQRRMEEMSDACAAGRHTTACEKCACPCHLTPQQALGAWIKSGLVPDADVEVLRAMADPNGPFGMGAGFKEFEPSPRDYWRGIVLFGRNVASFKFALGDALLEAAHGGADVVTLEDLALPFASRICTHLRGADKQGTSAESRFLDACRAHNAGELSDDTLRDTTVRLGFNNVIDAFHVVRGGDVPTRFFIDERRLPAKGIRLTDDLRRVVGEFQAQNLPSELEARWRLVETAWELNLPSHLLTVAYDPLTETILPASSWAHRKAIAPVRDALNGYQKGKCFYCSADISVVPGSEHLADVDHFLPHLLKLQRAPFNLDGVWNLVLACKRCNRGPKGKFDAIPALALLSRLHARNEHLIGSHHPLRDTLITQLGVTETQRHQSLQTAYDTAKGFGFGSSGWLPDVMAGPSIFPTAD